MSPPVDDSATATASPRFLRRVAMLLARVWRVVVMVCGLRLEF